MRRHPAPWDLPPAAGPGRPRRRPRLERLEDRLAPAGHTLATAELLAFAPDQTASAAGDMTELDQVDLYAVRLDAGDRLSVTVGSPRAEVLAALRVFDAGGRALTYAVLVPFSDPRLTFDAPAAGVYYVGLSGRDTNLAYDPVADVNVGGGPFEFDPAGYAYSLDVTRFAAPTREREAAATAGTNDRPDTAEPITGRTDLVGHLAPGDTDAYRLEVGAPGRLTARLSGPGGAAGPTRLVLLGAGGELLAQADAAAATPADLVARLDAGTYFLRAEGGPAAPADPLAYRLTTALEPVNPLERAAGGINSHPLDAGVPGTLAVGDVNGDGRLDLVTTSGDSRTVAILLGLGGGAFGPETQYRIGASPQAVVVADFDGDGRPDLAVAEGGSGDLGADDGVGAVAVLLNRGDGTFAPAVRYAAGDFPRALAVADFDGDGRPDLAVVNTGSHDVAILLGRGDGTFADAGRFVVGDEPGGITAGDFDADGITDLATANAGSGDVSVLLGWGNGTFADETRVLAGDRPSALAAADLDGDGIPDLVVANTNSGDLSVLRGRGDGTFAGESPIAAGGGPVALVVADLNGDGVPDLATANQANDVSVFLGRGGGQFVPQPRVPTGSSPAAVAAGDFDGDGRPDLVTANQVSRDLTVLPGRGDGSFVARPRRGVAGSPSAVAVADFDGDGRPDFVTANSSSDDVSVLVGRSDGTFAAERRFPVGSAPIAVAVGDFNGDGRADLAVANSGATDVSVLLGRGDGTFTREARLAVGDFPSAVVVADFNRDGRPDLAVVNSGGADVSVLLGRGDGTFRPETRFGVGPFPFALVAADFDGDGRPDLAVAVPFTDTVSVLWGRGDGTFAPEVRLAAPGMPGSLAVGDFNGDGRPDLVAGSGSTNDLTLFPGRPGRQFGPAETLSAGLSPFAIAVGDLDRDGRPDLVVVDVANQVANVMRGRGDGTFDFPVYFFVDRSPAAVALADFNFDGRLDVATASAGLNTVSVLLNVAAPPGFDSPVLLTAADDSHGVAVRPTPLYADLDGDGVADLIALDRAGRLLYRRGLRAGEFVFAPPDVVNPGRPARDVTAVAAGGRIVLAAADARPDPGAAGVAISLYAYDPRSKSFRRDVAFTVAGGLPVRVASADLDGDGLGDLVVASAFDNHVDIARQTAAGRFAAPVRLAAGNTPADLAFADLDGDGSPDVLVAGQVSGDVTVFFNDRARPDRAFGRAARYRAGAGPAAFGDTLDGPVGYSPLETVAVTAADFTGDGVPDLVAVNRGARALTLAVAAGPGLFPGPDAGPAFPTGARPGQALAADFDGDGTADVAVLMEDVGEVWTYLSRPGGFAAPVRSPAGPDPRGLAVADVDGDGRPDLLVGNEFGDVLALLGDGAGVFAPDRRNLREAPLAVTDLNGDGVADVVLANQALDRVSVLFRKPGTRTFSTPVPVNPAGAPLLAPGAVQLARLDADRYPDLVVASSLANKVLVFRGLAGGRFAAPVAYDVGFDPVAVTVGDLNGDGVPDLAVANHGSNDVSVLLGARGAGGRWTATAGPRLGAGGFGPLAVAARDVTGDRVPDLLVTNQDGRVVALPGIGSGGVGTGFFRDANPRTLDLGGPIRQARIDPTGAGLLVAADGGLRRFDPVAFAASTVFDFRPVAAVSGFGPGGFLAVAFDGGGVGLLHAGADGEYALAGTFAGFLGEPSALEVLERGGEFEVYVARRGEDVPVVLGRSDFIALATDVPEPAPNAEGSVVGGARLLVVAVLVPAPIATLTATPPTVGLDPARDGNTTSDGRLESLFPTRPVSARPAATEADDLLDLVNDEQDAGADASTAGLPVTPAGGAPGWEAWQLGVDDALARFTREPAAAPAPAWLPEVIDDLLRWLGPPAGPTSPSPAADRPGDDADPGGAHDPGADEAWSDEGSAEMLIELALAGAGGWGGRDRWTPPPAPAERRRSAGRSPESGRSGGRQT